MCARSCIIVCVCAHVKRVCVAEARNDSHESWVRVFHYFINLYYSPARGGGGGGHTTSYKIYIIQHHNTAGCVRVIYDLFFIYNEDIIGGQGRGAEEERTDPPVHVCIMYIRYTSIRDVVHYCKSSGGYCRISEHFTHTHLLLYTRTRLHKRKHTRTRTQAHSSQCEDRRDISSRNDSGGALLQSPHYMFANIVVYSIAKG